MDLPAVVDPAGGHGGATEVDGAPPVVDRLDTPVSILSAVNLPAVAMDLPAVVDPGEVGRLAIPMATPVECLLKAATVLLLVVTEPKLVIRAGGEDEAGTEGRGRGTEEREGTGGREGDKGMEGALPVIGRRSRWMSRRR